MTCMFQVKSLRSNDFVKIQRRWGAYGGVHPLSFIQGRVKDCHPLPKTAYAHILHLFPYVSGS